MLNRICQTPLMPSESPRQLAEKSPWERNELEDVKKAIEYLYEFKEKLSKLHPVAMNMMEHILQPTRY